MATAIESNERTGRATLVVVGTLALLAVVALLFAWTRNEDAVDRIEREHGITLPDSVRDAEAVGDASGPIASLIGLDRGASSGFLMDRADLPELLAELNAIGTQVDGGFFGDGHVAPANATYRLQTHPWAKSPHDQVISAPWPSSNGDFTNIGIYDIDETTVGIWLYTDWN